MLHPCSELPRCLLRTCPDGDAIDVEGLQPRGSVGPIVHAAGLAVPTWLSAGDPSCQVRAVVRVRHHRCAHHGHCEAALCGSRDALLFGQRPFGHFQHFGSFWRERCWEWFLAHVENELMEGSNIRVRLQRHVADALNFVPGKEFPSGSPNHLETWTAATCSGFVLSEGTITVLRATVPGETLIPGETKGSDTGTISVTNPALSDRPTTGAHVTAFCGTFDAEMSMRPMLCPGCTNAGEPPPRRAPLPAAPQYMGIGPAMFTVLEVEVSHWP